MSTIDTAAILNQHNSRALEIASQKKVVPDISPNDMLFDFLARVVFSADSSKAIDAYFNGGEDCASKFAALCREHLQPPGPSSVLEFASGYGRVARFAKHVLPETNWICSDVHPQAVDFISSKLGMEASLSVSEPGAWTLHREFDVVFALSFFSHMPATTFAPWLARLFRNVKPGGVLIFTTHGSASLHMWRTVGMQAAFDQRGFYWNSNSDQRDLDPVDYGTSAATVAFVERAVQAIPGAELIRFQQAYWWGHQDLYVVSKRA
ncbi:class I SAM-dependent methyltransferase [Bradyrhizobium diazoefficiens]|nr:class I SAM-dependent methyltransferase [Bradyrhizobium diazoefficiens]MBR0774554.1 class I SAM-dependent methyltransferase [Bradyrhizobium diazoefficiens]